MKQLPGCLGMNGDVDDAINALKVVSVTLRESLSVFAMLMEQKLRKNDHKNGANGDWAQQPIEAYVRLLKLEVAEFEVADDFFSVDKARGELVDVANFALILHDLLGKLPQDKNRHEARK